MDKTIDVIFDTAVPCSSSGSPQHVMVTMVTLAAMACRRLDSTYWPGSALAEDKNVDGLVQERRNSSALAGVTSALHYPNISLCAGKRQEKKRHRETQEMSRCQLCRHQRLLPVASEDKVGIVATLGF